MTVHTYAHQLKQNTLLAKGMFITVRHAGPAVA